MKIKYFIILFFFFTISFSSAKEVLLQAMRDEIKRSMESLQIEKLDKPYYIEYTLRINTSYHIEASLGSLINDQTTQTARLNVSVRIGDYKFDNSNFFDFGFAFFGSGDDEENYRNRTVPLELDYSSLRHELWLATDAAYKQATEIYTKKLATLQNRIRTDTTHDFIYIEPEKNFYKISYPHFDKERFINSVKNVSKIFINFPEIQNSKVIFEYIPETILYVNSEGREYIKSEFHSGFEVVAHSQADDGMPLSNFYSVYAKFPDDLPNTDSLLKAVKLIAEKLIELRKSPIIEESYSGPILFEGQAASEIVAQIFAPNLVAVRPPLTESGIQQTNRSSAFQNKIGGRVLPEFMSIKADPTINKFNKTLVIGNYSIDDQGVKAQTVELVKNGYLKNLLSGRTPTKRVKTSNGHFRSGGAMLSTILIESEKEYSKNKNELKKHLLKLVKDRELPYGIIVRKVLNQNVQFTTLRRSAGNLFISYQAEPKIKIIEAYRIYPDGREELIRGAEGSGFTPQSFKDIILCGQDKYALNYLAPSITSPYLSGGSQYIGATIISPDLLFEDGEINKIEEDFPKPPLYSTPLIKN